MIGYLRIVPFLRRLTPRVVTLQNKQRIQTILHTTPYLVGYLLFVIRDTTGLSVLRNHETLCILWYQCMYTSHTPREHTYSVLPVTQCNAVIIIT